MADDLDLAVLDRVDEVAAVALLEDHLARLVRQALRRPRLPRHGLAQVQHPVGQGEQAFVVGGHYHDPAGLGQLPEQPQHSLDLDVVQVRGRLIGQDQWRIVGEGAGDGDALLLTARQVAWAVVEALAEPEAVQQLFGAGPGLSGWHPGRPQWRLDVVAGGQAGHQVEGLEHYPHAVAPVLGEGGPAEGGHLGVADPDRARRRPQDRGQGRQQGRLARAAGPEQQHQLARGDLQVQAVDGADQVAAAGVFDGQVTDVDVDAVHHGPPKASAGCTPTARRSPAALATSPTSTATPSSRGNADGGISTVNGNPGASSRAIPTASTAAAAESSTACRASPARSERLAAPVALRTANSRCRSSADRYTIEPMIPAATSHSRALMNAIDWVPLARGRSRSAWAWASDSTWSPEGALRGTPWVMMVMASGWPLNPSAWASWMAAKTVGVPKYQVTRSAKPTTSSSRPPSSTRSPKPSPSAVSATTSPGPLTARPSASGGAPSPPGRAPITFTSRTEGRRSVECKITSGSARRTPGVATTRSVSAAGIGVEVVKGPDAPPATSQASAPSAATIRRPSLCRLASAPAISSVIPNTSEVASTAITNRRRRHCRSRSATRHISSSPSACRDPLCCHLATTSGRGQEGAPTTTTYASPVRAGAQHLRVLHASAHTARGISACRSRRAGPVALKLRRSTTMD